MPDLFIAYSSDSNAHNATILALANQLREDGIDAQLDQYIHGSPPEGRPQ